MPIEAVNPEDIARVRAATSLVGLFEEVTAVKRSGSRWTARCPFHDDHNPSLDIADDQGVYHCFGCQASGDAITFVREIHHLGFREAIEWLADRAGITITIEETPEARHHRQLERELGRAVTAAAEWYQAQLSTPEAQAARNYLAARRWDDDVLRRFGVGWAPPGRSFVQRALGIEPELAMNAGLVSTSEGGQPFDTLRDRVVFPIYDPAGRAVALAGRILPSGSGPKYVNFTETPLYKKRTVLYGLNWAKKAIVATDQVVVCEGYTDVIACHLAGVENAVATCGTAFTEDHVRVLSRFAKLIIVMLDADEAGASATERLHQWEQTHRVEFAVSVLPEGTDPAVLYETDRTDELRSAVDANVPLLAWRVERLFASTDLSRPEGRVSAANATMAMVAAHPNPLLREQYATVIHEQTGVDLETVLKAVRPSRRAAETEARKPQHYSTETEAIRLAIFDPEAVAEWIDPRLFKDPLSLRTLGALMEADTFPDAVAMADAGVAELLTRLSLSDAELLEADELRSRLVVAAAERLLQGAAREAVAAPDKDGAIARTASGLRVTLLQAREGDDPEAVQRLWEWVMAQEPPAAKLAAEPGSEERPEESPEEWL